MASIDNYPFQTAHWITKKLWWCAGADEYFLMRSPKQDRVKYAGIGGIVLCTGALAVFSGGFAFYTAFRLCLVDIDIIYISVDYFYVLLSS